MTSAAEPPVVRTIEAYIPLGGAKSIDELLPFTEGAAIVTIHEVHDIQSLGAERRIATPEDVKEFADAGKTIEAGQEVGPEGIPLTRFTAEIAWLDSTVESGLVVFTGADLEIGRTELEGVPLPDRGGTYLFFLRQSDLGYVPEAIQFTVREGTLSAHTFTASGLSQALAGRTVDDVRDEILLAYESVPSP